MCDTGGILNSPVTFKRNKDSYLCKLFYLITNDRLNTYTVLIVNPYELPM